MTAELIRIRKSFLHGGTRGGEAEATLREFLRMHLPLYTRVGHGEVFNKDGRRSRQTDVVVTNEEHPPLYSNWERAHLFIIEGIAAAGEVKTALQSLDGLRDTFDKARAFKSILAQPQERMLIYGTDQDNKRFVYRRPYFAFFYESKVSLNTMCQALEQWDKEVREVDYPTIDAVFVLEGGSIINFGDGSGMLKLRLPDGTDGRGYISRSDARDKVLPTLLLWMFSSMPRIRMWRPPIVEYLMEEEDSGPLMLKDDGVLSRKAPPRRER